MEGEESVADDDDVVSTCVRGCKNSKIRIEACDVRMRHLIVPWRQFLHRA